MSANAARDRWDAGWGERLAGGDAVLEDRPSHIVTAHLDAIAQRSGRAIDLACGLGPNIPALLNLGFEVHAADVSPVVLRAIDERATADSLSLRTLELDIEAGERPEGGFDIALITYFLDRSLLHDLPSILAPGGLALFAQPTVTNLERHQNPSARFCLETDEVAEVAEGLAEAGLTIITATEGWRGDPDDGPFEAWLVAAAPE